MIKRANDNFLNAWKDFPGSNIFKYALSLMDTPVKEILRLVTALDQVYMQKIFGL
jgi:hypothetical protein